MICMCCATCRWFQHTAARRRLGPWAAHAASCLSFNTQPPEGGWSILPSITLSLNPFQHTAARRRLDSALLAAQINGMFQHTAARRRLGHVASLQYGRQRFNTQPPEGGWSLSQKSCSIRFSSPDFAKLSRKA